VALVKPRILIAGIAAALLLGCASDSDNEGERSGGLTQADARVIATVDSYVNDWNRAAAVWSWKYKSGKRTEILRTKSETRSCSTKPL
jgi:hypothetical protein